MDGATGWAARRTAALVQKGFKAGEPGQ